MIADHYINAILFLIYLTVIYALLRLRNSLLPTEDETFLDDYVDKLLTGKKNFHKCAYVLILRLNMEKI